MFGIFEPTFSNYAGLVLSAVLMAAYASSNFRSLLQKHLRWPQGFEQFGYAIAALCLGSILGFELTIIITLIAYFLHDRNRWTAVRGGLKTLENQVNKQ